METLISVSKMVHLACWSYGYSWSRSFKQEHFTSHQRICQSLEKLKLLTNVFQFSFKIFYKRVPIFFRKEKKGEKKTWKHWKQESLLQFAENLSKSKWLNKFRAAGIFLSPLKISDNQWFSYVFRWYRKRPVAWNWLIPSSFERNMETILKWKQ